MRTPLAAAVALLIVAACGDNPTVSTSPTTRVTTTTADASLTDKEATDTVATDTAGATTTVTSATTTTVGELGPRATFKAAGRTLQVKATGIRRPYADLGDQLPVPADVQVDLGAPSAESMDGAVYTRQEWDSLASGRPIATLPGGEPNRFIWTADVPPGDYALEVTFTITGIPVTYRAPIRVT